MISGNVKSDKNVKTRARYLADPERVKKDLERERRITRLQQVREKSNSMARQIRQEVAAEKTRQIKNLESIKQKELNVWREHVMAKKHQDYRTSVFQVGAAHRAALVEIEKTEKQKQLQNERMKKCRRLAANRATKHIPVNFQRETAGKDLNVEGRATAGTQTPVPNKRNGKENRLYSGKCCKSSKCPGKSKHVPQTCFAECEQDVSDEEGGLSDSSWDDNAAQCAVNALSSSSGRRLERTPPIILDVDVESEDSLEICTRDGIDINDRHMQTNRKFSRVVRPSPTSSPVRQQREVEAVASRPRFTQISDLVRRNELPENRHCPQVEPPSSSPTRSVHQAATKSTVNEAISASPRGLSNKSTVPTSAPASPRQTQTQKRSSLRNTAKTAAPARVIDAGIKRSTALPPPVATQEAQPSAPVQPPRPVEPPRMQQQMPVQDQHMQLPQATMQQPHMQAMPMQPLPPYGPMYAAPMMPGYPSPMMTGYPNYPPLTCPMPPMVRYPPQPTYAAPQPMPTVSTNISNATPARTTAAHSSVSTTTTYVMRQKQGTVAETNTTGRVQFYDHNNKYYRNYKAPEQAVQANPPDATNLNAMDHARIETQLSQLREQELNKLRKVTEQRGQKALQREQVRRDCAELTEKLEALSQQQPQLLPSDANFVASHRYADLASRREQKMNEAMEKMLLRPAIVTCPEVGRNSHRSSPKKTCAHTKANAPQAINLGDPPTARADHAGDTESCCSLLLDYVDDQSKQLRTELKGIHSKSAKSIKLRNLLQRIDTIRGQLLAELKAGDMSGDNAQRVIDSIRQERANINTDAAFALDERELALQRKEAILEQRLRQLYKQQQKQRKKQDDEGTREIIIKVRSDGTVKQCVPKGKSQSKPAETDKPTTSSSSSSTDKKQGAGQLTQRQNSIDSNSTAYRELPSVNYENIRAAAAATVPTSVAQDEPLNPVIAQYVQRLLTMSPSTINQLGVSTSDVTTPSDSIVNRSGNRDSGSTLDETLVDQQRVERVQAFIQENRSFIAELEDTLQREQEQHQQRQQLPDKTSSEQLFDQIWMKRLSSKMLPQQQKESEQPKSQREPERPLTSQRDTPGQTRRSVTIATDAESTKNTAQSLAKLLSSQMKSKQLTVTEATSTSRSTDTQTQTMYQRQVINEVSSSSDKSAARHVERYAKLTENCTQRIAELTELITKVRGEKNRLVEVTLTSASEAERHSTEYFDLPPMQQLGQQQETRDSRTLSEGSDATQSNSEGLPLQKHKPTGASLDSGISVSRPMTAMGQELPDAEPLSLGSSSQPGTQRRGKVPPPTIRRYSPQLAAEELAHELSTITEVDTPAQSHIVAAPIPDPIPFPTFEQYAQELEIEGSIIDVNQSVRLQHEFQELIKSIKQAGSLADYREFPSIRAYLQETSQTQMRIRIEQSLAEQPTLTAIQMMQEMRLNNVSIHEFPTRQEYMKQLLAREPSDQRDLIDSASLESSDSLNVEAELRQRRILKSSFRRGPTSEYVEMDVASSTRRESIPPDASETAPNESGIEHLSRSLYEQDRRSERQLLSGQQQSNRQRSGSEQPRQDMQHSGMEHMQQLGRDLSGRQQPSTNYSGMPPPSGHHSIMPPPSMQRHVSMRQRERQPDHNCSTSSSSSSSSGPRRPPSNDGVNTTIDTPQEVSQMGRSLNLRDFLTKELLKHGRGKRVDSHSSEGTDTDSLKEHFLQSVIDSLSRSTSPHTPGLGHGTNATNDRQKTSTPVISFASADEGAGTLHSSDSQLFSIDSHISAVNYADGTPPIPSRSVSRNSKITPHRKPASASRK